MCFSFLACHILHKERQYKMEGRPVDERTEEDMLHNFAGASSPLTMAPLKPGLFLSFRLATKERILVR